MKQRILFICGSINQTTIAHQVAAHLMSEYDCSFTPYYAEGLTGLLARLGWLNFTILGGQFRRRTEAYLRQQQLQLDFGGRQGPYDLVITVNDMLIQHNIRRSPIILIQEGMTDPENFIFPLVQRFGLPRWLTVNTSANGLSNAYHYFCVASEGYRDFFIRKGVRPEKIVVTGIPNFDNVQTFLNNDFPHRDYVLAATSDLRETLRRDDRDGFIKRCLEIAGGRPLVFKLHPNERVERATAEIARLAPQALVFAEGDINPMIANCSVLITQYSSVVYIGLALGKEVHSYFNLELLKRLTPLQNGGTSSREIAAFCRCLLADSRLLSHSQRGCAALVNDPAS